MKIFGIGVDIVSNLRIKRILQQSYSQRFILKVLNKNHEIQEFSRQNSIQSKTKYLASRWAYKQALVKATGNKDLIFPQLYLQKNSAGKPRIIFENQNIKIVQALKIKEAHVSISHEDDYSVAFVIVTQ